MSTGERTSSYNSGCCSTQAIRTVYLCGKYPDCSFCTISDLSNRFVLPVGGPRNRIWLTCRVRPHPAKLMFLSSCFNSTIIHEGTHFDDVLGTDDYVYGQSDCKALAKSNPTDAVYNAEYVGLTWLAFRSSRFLQQSRLFLRLCFCINGKRMGRRGVQSLNVNPWYIARNLLYNRARKQEVFITSTSYSIRDIDDLSLIIGPLLESTFDDEVARILPRDPVPIIQTILRNPVRVLFFVGRTGSIRQQRGADDEDLLQRSMRGKTATLGPHPSIAVHDLLVRFLAPPRPSRAIS
jgi:hypothetical protein